MSRVMGKAGLVLASLALALLLGEVSVRSLRLAPQMQRLSVRGQESTFRLSDNPILGYEMKPDFVPDGPSTGVSFRTNSHGQRDIERNHDKSGPRILLLGDSVVQGIRTPDLDDTISRQLESLLASQRIEVLNFGVSGYNTRSEAELFLQKGLAFDPDLVILVFVANDQWATENQTLERMRYERPELVNWLLDHCQLFLAVADEWHLFRFGQEREAIAEQLAENRAALGKSPMMDGLMALREATDAQNSPLIIALWPSFGVDRVYYQPFLFSKRDPETMIIEQFAQKLGIATFRLDEVFVRDLQEHARESEPAITRYTGGPQLKTPRGDGMHANARASRLAAQGIRDYLAAHPEHLAGARGR